MRAAIVILLVLLPGIAAADVVSDELVAIEKRSWVAWQARDGAWFDGFLSDDHVEMGAGGPAGKQPIVAFVGSDKCEVRSYAVDRFTVTRYTDDVALLTYLATQDTTCYGKPVPRPSWTSSLYVRRNGKWQNALYQHSPAVQPPNGPQSAG